MKDPAGGASAEGDYGYNEPVQDKVLWMKLYEQQTTAKIAADARAQSAKESCF